MSEVKDAGARAALPGLPLERAPIEQTLRALGAGGGRVTRWRGWRRHGGVLAPPLAAAELTAIEAETGPLPDDYRRFLLQVAGAGAGPGYGLWPIADAAQRRFAAGELAWSDEQTPPGAPAGALVLGTAGCGVVWLLALAGAARGEVWLDSRAVDDKVRRAAPSFSEWYRDWLASAVADEVPWAHWDTSSCAGASVIARYFESMREAGIAESVATKELPERIGPIGLFSEGNPYFGEMTRLDPCHACLLMGERLKLSDEAFLPGGSGPLPPTAPPVEGGGATAPAEGGAAPPKRGLWKRLFGGKG